jgi:hypothetical protein
VSGLSVPNGPKLGTDLVISKHAEAEVLVQRPIPRNLGERRQRERSPAGLDSPDSDPLEQGRADPHPLIIWTDAHLLDVGVPIDLVDKDVADGSIGAVYRDPAPPQVRIEGQFLDRRRLMIRDGVQTDLAEPLSRQALDLLKCRTILATGGTNREHPDSMAVLLRTTLLGSLVPGQSLAAPTGRVANGIRRPVSPVTR